MSAAFNSAASLHSGQRMLGRGWLCIYKEVESPGATQQYIFGLQLDLDLSDANVQDVYDC